MPVGSSQFPAAPDTPDTLVRATNNAEGALSFDITPQALTVRLDSATEFPPSGIATIDVADPRDQTSTSSEIVYYSAKNFDALVIQTRGADGTAAKAWPAGSRISVRNTARHHNVLAEAVINTQTEVITKASAAALDAKLDKAGGTLTGALTLPGAPTAALHAATKAYVDANAGAGGGVASVFGRTGAVTAQQSDYDAFFLTTAEGDGRYRQLATPLAISDTTGLQAALDAKADDAEIAAINTALALKLDKSGGTLTGALTLSGAPTVNLHAATKKYVDDATMAAGAVTSVFGRAGAVTAQQSDYDAFFLTQAEGDGRYRQTATPLAISDTTGLQAQLDAKLDEAGGQMTGALTLASAPTLSLHAATKQYVDDATIGAGAVTSVFGRAGAVTAQQSDYDAFFLTQAEGDGRYRQTATPLAISDTTGLQAQLDAKLDETGGTMTGALTLAGAPTLDLHAATKAYVDASQGGVNQGATYDWTGAHSHTLPVTTRGTQYRLVGPGIGNPGGTDYTDGMMFSLYSNSATNRQLIFGPTDIVGNQARAGLRIVCLDGKVAGLDGADGGGDRQAITLGTDTHPVVIGALDFGVMGMDAFPAIDQFGAPAAGESALILGRAETSTWNRVKYGANGTLYTGATDPTTTIDTALGLKLDKAGGTMTGALTLAGAPSLPLHAATKAYVDSQGGGSGEEAFGWYYVDDQGFVADGVTDNLAAWNALQSLIGSRPAVNGQLAGTCIVFGHGSYYFSGSMEVQYHCIFQGSGGGAFGTPTVLMFAAGVTGMRLHRPLTGLVPAGSEASNSQIRDLNLTVKDSTQAPWQGTCQVSGLGITRTTGPAFVVRVGSTIKIGRLTYVISGGDANTLSFEYPFFRVFVNQGSTLVHISGSNLRDTQLHVAGTVVQIGGVNYTITGPGPNGDREFYVDTPLNFTFGGAGIDMYVVSYATVPDINWRQNLSHGIEAFVRVQIRDVHISNFTGDGVNMDCSYGVPPQNVQFGAANAFQVQGVECQDNWGHGFMVRGADSNAGIFNSCSAVFNAAWGFRDESFLGNVFIGCHTNGNWNGTYWSAGPGIQKSTFLSCYQEDGQTGIFLGVGALALGGFIEFWHPWSGGGLWLPNRTFAPGAPINLPDNNFYKGDGRDLIGIQGGANGTVVISPAGNTVTIAGLVNVASNLQMDHSGWDSQFRFNGGGPVGGPQTSQWDIISGGSAGAGGLNFVNYLYGGGGGSHLFLHSNGNTGLRDTSPPYLFSIPNWGHIGSRNLGGVGVPMISMNGGNNVVVDQNGVGVAFGRGTLYKQSTGDPTTADVPDGQCVDWLNTTTNVVRRWANVGGALRSITYAP